MNTKITISFLIFPIFLLISCQKSDLQPIENENLNSVSFQEAKSIASNCVSDGFSSAYYCQIRVSTLYLHMNWGASGFYDGYYA